TELANPLSSRTSPGINQKGNTMAVTFTEEVESQAMDSSMLGLAADTLDDIEALRKATANRVNAMTRSTADKDGEVRGLGLMALGLDTDVDKAVEMLESIKK